MPVWVVDTHVHISRSLQDLPFEYFPVSRDTEAHVAVLLERAGESFAHQYFCHCARHSPIWEVREEDSGVTYLRDATTTPIRLILLGSQHTTAEGLEILSLAKPMHLQPSQTNRLETLVERIAGEGGIPVIAWAPGKWCGSRGRLLKDLISDGRWNGRLAFSDNANRPVGWPYPRLLRSAAEAGFSVLNGSDSLPLRGEENRIGSAGVFVAAGPLESPADHLRRALTCPDSVTTFGQRMNIDRFIHNQLLIRLNRA